MRTKSLDILLESPDAWLVIQEAMAILNNEKEKRQSFYHEITESMKAEFINGEVVVHSPAMKRHISAIKLLLHLLDIYVEKYQLGYVAMEKSLIKLTRNDYEPDICFFKQEKAQYFTEEQLFFPAPDLVVEVLSKSTEKNDRGIKFQDYEAHQIKEYWIIDPDKQTIEQYYLENEHYELILKASSGNIRSFVVKNFEIPIQAIFDKDLNAKILKEIITQ
jgi:Uma2 family endonuclease